MGQTISNISADVLAIQERDEFCSAGWIKLIAPAKVNLFLAIGAHRSDGYHDVSTVMHSLALHDIVYMRYKTPADATYGTGEPEAVLTSSNDLALPELNSADNLATRAVMELARELEAEADLAAAVEPSGEATPTPTLNTDILIRIEKSIPFQGGLGGGSTDAAAALVGAAALAGISKDHPAIERTARKLGADVAFFLYGGCAYFEGTGDHFVHSLTPEKCAIALIKPHKGVSTAEAYRTFDAHPVSPDVHDLAQVSQATAASQVPLYNNLAPAAEQLLPELARLRQWTLEQPGVTDALLCGSGATTFAVCENLAAALAVVSEARKQGLWARTTSLSAIGAALIKDGRL